MCLIKKVVWQNVLNWIGIAFFFYTDYIYRIVTDEDGKQLKVIMDKNNC